MLWFDSITSEDMCMNKSAIYSGKKRAWHSSFHHALERGHDREEAKKIADKLNPKLAKDQ
jgi:hypothetical protein